MTDNEKKKALQSGLRALAALARAQEALTTGLQCLEGWVWDTPDRGEQQFQAHVNNARFLLTDAKDRLTEIK